MNIIPGEDRLRYTGVRGILLKMPSNAVRASKRSRTGEVRLSQSMPAVTGDSQNPGFQSAAAYKKRSSRYNRKYKEISFRQERKAFTYTGTGANVGVQNGAGTQGLAYGPMNNMSTGTGSSSRIGSRICCVGGKAFFTIYPMSAVAQQDIEVDIEIWNWKNPSGATNLSVNDLYINDPATSTITGASLRNIDYMQDFQLLASKKVLLKAPGVAGATANQQVELGWKGKVYTDFNAAGAYTKGMVVLVVRTSNSKPTTLDLSVANSFVRFNYNTVLYYVDN